MRNESRWPKLNGHSEPWVDAIARGLGHESHSLTSVDSENRLQGVLPLLHVRSPFFGSFLVSLPYLNTGGVWADDPSIATQLVDQAVAMADRWNVKHLELRHEVRLDHPRLTQERTDKVHMRLALPTTADQLLAGFKSKLRSQIKKSGEQGLVVQFGGVALLAEFYSVFAVNMRDLGTPVYSKRLFHSILQSFGEDAELCVVRKDGRAIAASLLVHYPGLTEVPSASSLRKFGTLGANMWMYWHLLQRAIERGAATFDFGRSSEGSGTYKFKEQWGAKPFPACWQYYVRQGSPADMRPDSPKKKKLIEMWSKLPVWVTKIIGPAIVRGIP